MKPDNNNVSTTPAAHAGTVKFPLQNDSYWALYETHHRVATVDAEILLEIARQREPILQREAEAREEAIRVSTEKGRQVERAAIVERQARERAALIAELDRTRPARALVSACNEFISSLPPEKSTD